MKQLICFVAVLALCSTQIADADVIDFQDLEHVDNLLNDEGFVYTSGPWMVSHPNTEPFEFATSGTLNPTFYQGSTMLFNNTVDGVITVERIDGGEFDLKSIDIAALFVGAGGVGVEFVSSGGDVSSFTTPDGFGGYTHSFGSDFEGITSVSWVQAGALGFHQFDNINLNAGVIPEPSSFMALALAGMAIVVRRRKK